MNAEFNPNCPITKQCAFYQKSNTYMPPISKRLRTEYCLKTYTECACWKIFSTIGHEWLPISMLPYQHEWAKQILNEVGIGHEKIIHHEHVSATV